ncbi:2-oxoacid:acceptor oxidoreductase subunit alpha [Methanolobus halotolerans]|uniref:2-oxoglutarate synthase subunit KorA n=1 Tax=Methanolobus halotolerans TaxID=2052935 RepID=A0A4E0PVT2_9EURY|nr:2-oxoacid:acceptor oxidoreductase subunit alpha [Methanolobus halotolerans]TGC08342.1 2-oxoacid:acceptor oxidoreductase subunit alpha [Methanolobus halotolerans]
MKVDLTIKIGGAAGQGLDTIGSVLSRTLMKCGFFVFGTQYYLSRIRGGHNTFQMRISDESIKAMDEKVDMLVALDRASIEKHLDEMTDGVVIVDMDTVKPQEEHDSLFHVPLLKIAKDTGGNKLYANSVAVGAVMGLMCLDFDVLAEVLSSIFKKKGQEVIDNNIKAARAGYDHARDNYPHGCKFGIEQPEKHHNKMLISGNEAVGLGALAAGLQFISSYPMTPSTGVMNYIAGKANKFGLVFEQAEDEIAALNMVLGASFTGARSMVTTSGGGFCLMVEALGLAGITETPVVIFQAQRPGPATGLPTMTEQGDLLFAIHAAQGEFPRCVLAPGTPQDCFYMTAKAFNIADKYQIPVIVMSDQYLADSLFTCERFDQAKISIERHLLSDEDIKGMQGEYRRYKITSSGISPRALPGQDGVLVGADSDEHDEFGHIDETQENRISMVHKRMNKLELLREEMQVPGVHGPEDAELTLIGWGSTYGPLAESVDTLNGQGHSVNLVHFTHVYPLPAEKIRKLLAGSGKKICVENNRLSQFARLLAAETGIEMYDNVVRYDGLPFTPESIIDALREKGVV